MLSASLAFLFQARLGPDSFLLDTNDDDTYRHRFRHVNFSSLHIFQVRKMFATCCN